MFTAFRCDEPAQQQPRIITPPDITSSSSSTQYSRTACDFCRAKKLRCLGTGEACDRCLASSSACTYTFSSGVGPGKKRRRKVWDPRLTDVPSRRPISPRSGSSPECDDGSLTNGTSSSGTSNSWNRAQDATPATSVTLSGLPNRHAVSGTEDNNTSTSTSTTHQDRDKYWSDVPLSGNGFALCPAKHLSAVPNPTLRLEPQSHSVHDFDNPLDDNETSLLDQDILQLFELSPPRIRDDASTRPARESHPGQTNLQSADLDLTPPFTPQPSSSGCARASRRNKSVTSQDQLSEPSSSCASGRCNCLSSVLRGLDELDLQRNADAEATPTDTLFLSVERGIDQFSILLACMNCGLNDLSPMLVVTAVNHLALMLSELVHRLTHCQSADTVPTVFQFGRYSVQKTKMRTSLLTSMIELHVKCLSQLIIRLEACMVDQPRLLLAGAKSIVTKMQQTLQAFMGGPYSDYDG
ncbi:hypothetical protein V2A60_006481 [Cordyceps javanica]